MVRTRLLLLLLCGACMKAPDPSGMPSSRPAAPPTLSLEVPADWQPLPPDQSFYLGKWQLPDGAIASISWLGADQSREFIVQNVQRWLGEWTTAAGEPIGDYQFDKTANGGFAMHRIQLTGTLTGVRQLGGGEPRPDWSLDGVVIETASGPLFFKLIGPQAVVAGQSEAVWRTLAGLELRE